MKNVAVFCVALVVMSYNCYVARETLKHSTKYSQMDLLILRKRLKNDDMTTTFSTISHY